MANKIKSLLRKAYNKLLRRKSDRAIRKLRETMALAYPDGARFISLIGKIPEEPNSFLLKESLLVEGRLASKGVQSSSKTIIVDSETISDSERRRFLPADGSDTLYPLLSEGDNQGLQISAD